MDAIQPAALLGSRVVEIVDQHLGEAENRGEWRPQLVGDVGEELVAVAAGFFERHPLQELVLVRAPRGAMADDHDQRRRAEEEEILREDGAVRNAAPQGADCDVAADHQYGGGR